MIDKDTKIYGSFSKNPGNNGTIYFNEEFKKNGKNAIYKSFYCDNIEKCVESAKTLNFGGFAVSMPYKKEVLKHVDVMSDSVQRIGSANTVKIINDKLYSYNTDYKGIINYFEKHNYNSVYILGDGSFSDAARYAFDIIGINYLIINRTNWSSIENLKNMAIFNCTPVKDIYIDDTCIFVDGIPDTDSGKKIAKEQAKEQLKIYLNE